MLERGWGYQLGQTKEAINPETAMRDQVVTLPDLRGEQSPVGNLRAAARMLRVTLSGP